MTIEATIQAKSFKRFAIAPFLLFLFWSELVHAVVDYDIVYVRAPRNGDFERAQIAEVFDPIKLEAGTDLVLLRPDGSQEVLVDCDRSPFIFLRSRIKLT